jgi:hypothetical protein
VIGFVLGVILLAMFLADQQDFEESPIYYSPWLVPVYKYDTQLNDVVSHLVPVGVLLGFISLLLLWSLVATAELRPIWIGISITCGAEVIFVVIAIFLVNATGIEFNRVKAYVDALIVKEAWLDSKQNLIDMLNLNSRAQYVSYEDWWRRRFYLRQYVNAVRGRNALDFPD